MAEYSFGDHVWVETKDFGKRPGVVLEWDGEEYWITWLQKNGARRHSEFHPTLVSPRHDEDARPRTWRLPEKRDVVRVVGERIHDDWKHRDYEIHETLWSMENPIWLVHEHLNAAFGLRDIELVRLHDDPSHGGEKKQVKPEPAVVVAEAKSTTTLDSVNHPSHYTSHPSGVECIEVARHFNFNLGNVLKYIWREAVKGQPIEDLRKAAWYLNDEIQRRQKLETNRVGT